MQKRTAKQIHVFVQGLEALLNQQSVIEINIDCREREAEYNKKVAEKEWSDLMRLLRNRMTKIKERLVLLVKRA